MDKSIPRHIAIIMDGNGRWARKRGLPRNIGHKKGMENAEKILDYAHNRGVKILSLFTFSTENWTRPREEIGFLFSSLKEYLKKKKKKLMDENIRLNLMGRKDNLPQDLLAQIDDVEAATRNNKDFVINLVFNYGGRAEIVDAANKILLGFKQGKIKDSGITEENFQNYLYSPFVPDVDLLIRTSGEQRISNFLLWRAAYCEIYFTKTLWPDFGPKDFDKALEEFAKRDRRFGGIKTHV
ncbi:MAG: isoprenyl transferase [Candidatus Omnitrophica bacterium]|nr:isoprenyl transferase [Candidatus Omnitrophota bacterium]